MPPLRLFTNTRRVIAVPESAKTPAQPGGPRRFPQTAPKAVLDINDLVETAKTSTCSREAGRAMTNVRGWVLKEQNLRPLFLIMDHDGAIPGIRKHAGEIILGITSDDRGKDAGSTPYFKRAGDRMAAIVRVKEAVPELASLADSIIKKKYKG